MQRLLGLFGAFATCATAFPAIHSSVAVGRGFSFVIDKWVAYAVGKNEYGQLGVDTEMIENRTDSWEHFSPVALPGTVKRISAGAFHSLFLMKDGTVYASGRNNHGQLALPDETVVQIPQRVQALENVTITSVAAGYAHSLFLTDAGAVWVVGYNGVGQLGDNSTIDKFTPVQLFESGMRAIAAGYDFSYFLDDSGVDEFTGAVFATGQNLGGQLGDGTLESSLIPVMTKLEPNVASIAAGESHGLFSVGGEIYGTGANHMGQLGTDPHTSPTTVSEPQVVVRYGGTVFAGGDSSCMVINGMEGTTMVTGSNFDGQLGRAQTTKVHPAYKLTETKNGMMTTAIGERHSLFLEWDGLVFSSGLNSNMELGDGRTEAQSKLVDADRGHGSIGQVTVPPTPAPTPFPTPAPTPVVPTPAPSPSAPSPSPDGKTPQSGPSNVVPIVVSVISGIVLVVMLSVCCRTSSEESAQDGAQEMVVGQVSAQMSV